MRGCQTSGVAHIVEVSGGLLRDGLPSRVMSKAFIARFSAAFVGEGPRALTARQRLLPLAHGLRLERRFHGPRAPWSSWGRNVGQYRLGAGSATRDAAIELRADGAIPLDLSRAFRMIVGS